MPRRRVRRGPRKWLGLAGIVLLLLLLAWRGVPSLVQSRVTHALDEAGLGPAHFTLAWNGPFVLETGALQLGASGALTADSADISFSPRGLAAGRIDALRLTGLHLAARIDASGHVAVADLPDFTASGESQLPALPVDRIILRAARLDADTPAGPVALGLDATLTSGAAGLSLASTLAISFGAARLSLPDLALAPEPGGWRLTAMHATGEDSALGVALAGIAIDLDWKGGTALLTAEVGQVGDSSKPARFPPLAAKLVARSAASRIDFTLDGADEKARIKLSASGRHDLGTGRGSARISGTVQPFHAQGLQPRDLSPAFAQDLPPIDGRIGLGGSIDWVGTRIAPHLSFTLADLAGSFDGVRMSGGRGALQLDSLQPPATPPGQAFAASLSFGDTDPMPLDLRFQLQRDGTLAIESLSLGLAEGRLRSGDLLLKPAEGLAQNLALPVQVTGVELGTLLRLIAIDGLSGEGKLDGEMPLQLAEGAGGVRHMLLQHGRLTARGPGVLRYVGGGLPAQAGAGAQSVALLRDVLKDFRYRSLAAELDQGADGSGGVLLHLDGSNPAVLNGRRFLLNIRLDANFDRLAQLFLSGLEAAQDLTRNSLAPRR